MAKSRRSFRQRWVWFCFCPHPPTPSPFWHLPWSPTLSSQCHRKQICQFGQPQLPLRLCFCYLISVVVETRDKCPSLALVLLTQSASRRCGVEDAGLHSIRSWDNEPGLCPLADPPVHLPRSRVSRPRLRSKADRRPKSIVQFFAEPDKHVLSHTQEWVLPSFLLCALWVGFLGSSVLAREAVGSKDINNTLWLADPYHVKTPQSSRQLDPLWSSSESPQRGLPLKLQVMAWSLPTPLCDCAVCLLCVPLRAHQPHARLHFKRLLRLHPLHQ